MKLLLTAIFPFILVACHSPVATIPKPVTAAHTIDTIARPVYAVTKKSITEHRLAFARTWHSSLSDSVSTYWVSALGDQLYWYWKDTPWDFNGITQVPREGSIACGYFVTTLLQDMGVQLNRVQLSVCASSEMMKKLVPGQRMMNLSSITYGSFADSLKNLPVGVYIIGLDYHTGFIINDGLETWFLHSNYIGKQGVIKEPVAGSAALQSSKTRWMVSLTGDRNFIKRWLNL